MVWGFFFVRPIPLPHSEITHSSLEHGHGHARSESATRILARDNNSTTHLLKDDTRAHEDDDEDDVDGAMSASVEFYPSSSTSTTHHHHQESSDYVVPRSPGAVAMSPTRSSSNNNCQRSRSSLSISRSRSRARGVRGVRIGIGSDGLPNLRGMALAVNGNFWLLFTITSLRKSPVVLQYRSGYVLIVPQ